MIVKEPTRKQKKLGYSSLLEAYEEWKQNQMAALAPVALTVKNAIEAKANTCLDASKPPVGKEAYRVTRRGERVNFTSYTLKKMPREARDALMGLMGDGEVSKRECKDADCLHPCFGPLHASNCNKCYKTWVQTRGKMKSKACDLCEIDYEEWTEPHIMTFEEKMIDLGKADLLN